ncbi:MAG: hypothetical protein PHE17_20520 [Thiothrix sp.]|nr:hypothetical protein [Thiothrix sp.]
MCRLAPCFALGGGVKGLLPSLASVDVFPNPAVEVLAEQVDSYLSQQGLVRLDKRDLTPVLPTRYQGQLDTNLGTVLK